MAVTTSAPENTVDGEPSSAAVLDAIDALVAVLDPQGRIVATNARWRRAGAERNAGEACEVGADYLAICDAADDGDDAIAGQAAAAIRRVIAGTSLIEHVEYECATESDQVWFEARITPIEKAHGGGCVVAHIDVSGQVNRRRRASRARDAADRRVATLRAADEALASKRNLLDQIINALPAEVYWKDLGNRYLGSNRRYADALGLLAPGELVGTVDGPDALIDDATVIAAGEPVLHERRRVPAPDGADRELDVCRVPLFDGPDPTGLLGMNIDRTAEVALERKLAQTNKLQSIGELAAGIAHEINTPVQYVGDNINFVSESFTELRSLLTAADALVRRWAEGGRPDAVDVERYLRDADADYDFLDEEIPDALAQAGDGVDRVKEIVRAMKEFSHPAGQERTDLDLNKALRTAATVTRSVWKYVAELTFDLDDELPSVPCYIGPLNQVIVNIIVNAAQALEEQRTPSSPGGEDDGHLGSIAITTRLIDDDTVAITIADDGPGMPSEVADRIFDPFFTTKDVGRGTGQGLAIAHQVVEQQHGGSLTVDTAPGRGATFTIHLPRQAPTPDAAYDEHP